MIIMPEIKKKQGDLDDALEVTAALTYFRDNQVEQHFYNEFEKADNFIYDFV